MSQRNFALSKRLVFVSSSSPKILNLLWPEQLEPTAGQRTSPLRYPRFFFRPLLRETNGFHKPWSKGLLSWGGGVHWLAMNYVPIGDLWRYSSLIRFPMIIYGDPKVEFPKHLIFTKWGSIYLTLGNHWLNMDQPNRTICDIYIYICIYIYIYG